MTIDNINNLTKEQILHSIRIILLPDGSHDTENHYRFEMSGYESLVGDCTVKNIDILNKFAYLGIYDYTRFLFLDFYKGTPTIYLSYWGEKDYQEGNYDGYGTTEIIYEILRLTVLSGKRTRRR